MTTGAQHRQQSLDLRGQGASPDFPRQPSRSPYFSMIPSQCTLSTAGTSKEQGPLGRSYKALVWSLGGGLWGSLHVPAATARVPPGHGLPGATINFYCSSHLLVTLGYSIKIDSGPSCAPEDPSLQSGADRILKSVCRMLRVTRAYG